MNTSSNPPNPTNPTNPTGPNPTPTPLTTQKSLLLSDLLPPPSPSSLQPAPFSNMSPNSNPTNPTAPPPSALTRYRYRTGRALRKTLPSTTPLASPTPITLQPLPLPSSNTIRTMDPANSSPSITHPNPLRRRRSGPALRKTLPPSFPIQPPPPTIPASQGLSNAPSPPDIPNRTSPTSHPLRRRGSGPALRKTLPPTALVHLPDTSGTSSSSSHSSVSDPRPVESSHLSNRQSFSSSPTMQRRRRTGPALRKTLPPTRPVQLSDANLLHGSSSSFPAERLRRGRPTARKSLPLVLPVAVVLPVAGREEQHSRQAEGQQPHRSMRMTATLRPSIHNPPSAQLRPLRRRRSGPAPRKSLPSTKPVLPPPSPVNVVHVGDPDNTFLPLPKKPRTATHANRILGMSGLSECVGLVAIANRKVQEELARALVRTSTNYGTRVEGTGSGTVDGSDSNSDAVYVERTESDDKVPEVEDGNSHDGASGRGTKRQLDSV